MLGKITHTRVAEKDGARFCEKMSNEDHRHYDNLMLVCGKHHDIIDYPDNIDTHSSEVLSKFKAEHKEWFRRAEHQLIEQVTDTTQATQPTYPRTKRSKASDTSSTT